tara:strand:- start:1336 stop:1569 length:234 start_codon:yes stop_codon:yes gene_type:complete
MSIKPRLVDYSEFAFEGNKIKKKIYTKTEKISIFLNGILIISILLGLGFLYYRHLTKEENERELQLKLEELNNLIYS